MMELPLQSGSLNACSEISPARAKLMKRSNKACELDMTVVYAGRKNYFVELLDRLLCLTLDTWQYLVYKTIYKSA